MYTADRVLTMQNTILVIEDEENIRDYLEKTLTESGFVVHTSSDGAGALAKVEKITPDLVLLDLGLPNISGETVCKEIKKEHPEIPVIILTAKNKTEDVLEGFNLGADDYIPKPFNTDEVIARIKARLKGIDSIEAQLQVGDLVLDKKTYEAKRGHRNIKLTPKEFKLLEYLMINKGRIIPREMILNRIWLYSPDIESRAVDVYIGYIRKKIDTGFDKKLLHTLRGFGYMIKE